jgi:hypothetical protein
MAELEQAEPPCVPEPTVALLQARAAVAEHRERRERLERSSVVRGLIVLALLVLGLSMLRAGWGRVFVPGWWRQW